MKTAPDREAIRVRLAEIELANGGRLTAAAVVDDAKNPDSPLHGSFEWDTDKAAYAHWIEQARSIITSVRVLHKTDTTQVRAVYYVRDPSAADNEQGYVSVNTLRSDSEMAREAILNEFSRAAHLLRRARELAVALDGREEIDGLIRSVLDVKARFAVGDAPAKRYAMGRLIDGLATQDD